MRIRGLPEAAEHIGVSQHTLARYVREGRVPAMHFGRRVLIDLDALERWLLDQREPTVEEVSAS